MNRKYLLVRSAVLVVALMVSGCVPKSALEKLEAEKNQEIGALKSGSASSARLTFPDEPRNL